MAHYSHRSGRASAAEPIHPADPAAEGGTMSNPAFKFDHIHIISENPKASAEWYVEMFGATITADTIARGAPQIFVDLGGKTILIRGRRPGEAPVDPRPIRQFADFSSHDARGIDHISGRRFPPPG
jgi:catechol 2,3-dioxygenase-like lactoylglutathione lyase family enzyme